MTLITRDTPFVVCGDDWRRHVSTVQHLFSRIIPSHTVVWVNSFGHRPPRLTVYDLRRAAAKVGAMVRGYRAPAGEPAPACIIEPHALPWHTVRAVRAFNTWSLRRDILRALHRVAPGRPPVFITGTPAAFGLVGTLDELVSLYFCQDDYGQLPGVSAALIEPLEAALLERVDAVVATAAALTTLRRPRSGRAYQLPQGVNYERFATPMPVPSDLAGLPRPLIGFAGGVGSACDFPIIGAIATALPDASIVLVGPLEPGIVVPALPNIHRLGPRPYEALPAYVQHFDVGVIPYVHNAWTASVDPLKLLEYLAAGIPVVTTGIPEVHKYRDVVRVADAPEPFVAAVRAAIDQPRDPGPGRAVARANTWETRAQQLLDLAETVAQERRAAAGSQRQAAPRRRRPPDAPLTRPAGTP